MNNFLISFSLLISLILGDPQLTVFRKYAGLSGNEIFSINSMITQLNNYGTALQWDGSQTSDETTLISRVESGTYQVLLALNPSNSAAIWSVSTQTSIESALNSVSNSMDKLLIWDRYANINPNAPGLNGLVTRSLAATICPVTASVPPSTGPASETEVGCWSGNWASHGSFGVIDYFLFLAEYPEAVAYYVESISNNPTHVHYCFNGANVMYSGTPMDFYLNNRANPAASNYFVNTMDLLMNSDVCGPACPECVSDCTGMANGNYPSCDVACDSTTYATCVHGILYDERPCGGGALWNDDFKTCQGHSSCPCDDSATPARCAGCVDSCLNVDDGNYASCNEDCSVYASCSGGVLYDNRPCPEGLIWNDAYRSCSYSTLCEESDCFEDDD